MILAVQGGDGCKILLRYTLQQHIQQDVKSLHTDAWLEPTSTAGQRALQVNDDRKWTVIPSSGLQRAAVTVGAGGIMKKNLPVRPPHVNFCCHKRSNAACLICACMLLLQLTGTALSNLQDCREKHMHCR